MYTLFIFRRDFRITDNTGFNAAMAQQDSKTIPLFIFTPTQTDSKKNKYFSAPAYHFMIESLQCLHACLQQCGSALHVFYGDELAVLQQITKHVTVVRVMFNQDYTPYSRKRDSAISRFCKTNSIHCLARQDYLLHPMDQLLKKDSTMYEIFTPYRNNALKKAVPKPSKATPTNLVKVSLPTKHKTTLTAMKKRHPTITTVPMVGGRHHGLQRLKDIKKQKQYGHTRNSPSIPTTELSPYIKFGCVSIREVMEELVKRFGKEHELVSQLYWREFYTTVTHYHPRVLQGKTFSTRFRIKWRASKKDFDKWCTGTTGYPIVDAGMAQLNQTGFQHNRLRLICSNFLNRILGMDWRKGEQYYAQQLVDYDPAVNNGNWQWIASTGVDPKPYNQRLFNPWLQSKRFDPECAYIKTWLPCLKDVPNPHLHQWDKHHCQHEVSYPRPCVEYTEARQRSVGQYKSGLVK